MNHELVASSASPNEPDRDWWYGNAPLHPSRWGSACQRGAPTVSDSRIVPRPGQAQKIDNDNAVSALLVCFAIIALFPGALLGALVAWSLWRVLRPDSLTKWLVAGLGVALVAISLPSVVVAWPWRLLLSPFFPSLATDLTSSTVAHSVPFEAALGPVVLAVFEIELWLRSRTVQGREWIQYREMESRKKALERGWAGPAGSGTQARQDTSHPATGIRLGLGASDGNPFDLGRDELAQHVFIPGASSSGKTTTIVRLSEGAIGSGYSVVIVDCKGSGLAGDARRLAARNGQAFTIVDPHDPDTVGYDPCTGDAPGIANKLIGAFTFGADAEIYKQVAMEVIPVICRAMVAAGREITLDSLYRTLSKGELSRLGRAEGAEDYRDRLESLDEAGGIGSAGYIGLQKRLGALMEGTFGDLFRQRPALDWRTVMSTPGVTYLSLSATAAGEDVDLFGRVIIQDLKQICSDRMRAIDRGEQPRPVLIVFDEFAALREPLQIVDLLLQARGALTPLVVAIQILPEEPSIRRPLMSSGVLIIHRLAAEDAESAAAEFGTRTVPMLTAQVDYETGETPKGSVRSVEEFNIHPNTIKELPVGMAAVYARRTNRRQLVQVIRTPSQ